LAPYTLQGDIFEYGAGYLDIEAALNNTDLTSLPALSATAASSSTTSSSSNVVTISRNFSTSWGSSTVWSDLLVYGSQVFSGVNASGLSILWGSTAIWDVDDGGGGFYVIWGETNQLPALVTALAVGGGDFSVVWGD